MNDVTLINGLSDAERLTFMERIYDLLSHQTTKYLSGDSTSIPANTAEELLRSLVYTLRLTMLENGTSERELLTTDLDELLQHGQRNLQNKLTAVHALWERACLTLPEIPNDYLQDTLKAINGFFKHYDLWYFAHQIPCVIDYPLCIQISEELQGVSYVEQWLHCLLIENWLLSRFQPQTVSSLLSETVIDYWKYPLNLCEQPIVNAVGLAILGRSALPLKISDEDCHEISKLLFGCDDIKAELNRGVTSISAELCAPKEVETYIRTVLYNTLPRIRSARQYGSVRGIFIVS